MAKIISHNDTDGLVSAVLLYHIKPEYEDVELISHAKYKDKKVTLDDAVLDLPEPEQYGFWADHHSQSRPTETSRPDAPSCARVLYDHFKKDFPSLEKYKTLVEDTDMIDSAGYISPKDITDLNRKGNIIRHYLSSLKYEEMNDKVNVLIKALAQGDFTILNEPEIYDSAKKQTEKISRFRETASPYINLEDGIAKMEITDESKKNIEGPLDRFAHFVKFPEAKYGCLIYQSGKRWRMNFSKNPFSKEGNPYDIGRMMENVCGGGGHPDIGSHGNLDLEEKIRVYDEMKKRLKGKL